MLETTGLFASVTGELADLPGGSLGFAAGLETRRQTGDFKPDQFLAVGFAVEWHEYVKLRG